MCQIQPHFWSEVVEGYLLFFCSLHSIFPSLGNRIQPQKWVWDSLGACCDHPKTFLTALCREEACLSVASRLRWGSWGLLVVMVLPEGEANWRGEIGEEIDSEKIGWEAWGSWGFTVVCKVGSSFLKYGNIRLIISPFTWAFELNFHPSAALISLETQCLSGMEDSIQVFVVFSLSSFHPYLPWLMMIRNR